MLTNSQSYPEPVAKLMKLGDVSGQPEWADYIVMGLTAEHVPDLSRMVLDEDLFWAETDSDEVWSGLHAWRALAQLEAAEAMPTLMQLLARLETYDDDWAFKDLPVVFAHIGVAAIPSLRDFLADARQGTWTRITAADGLVKIVERHPDQHAECVAIMSHQLTEAAQQDPTLNGFLISDLVDLQAVEAAPAIEQAFATGQVDLTVQGDWEDVQIRLGLLTERQTPPPDYRALITAQTGITPDALTKLGQVLAQKAHRKQERQAADRAKARAKRKRKQAKKSRKKQRKRK